MTKKLFWDQPYQTTNKTSVATVEGTNITVDETVFYAFSGGQESDAGTIAGYPVLDAVKRDKTIEYNLPEDHNLQPGDEVTVKIDGERRLRLMRLHFAAELVLELFYKKFPTIQKIGAHIAANKARVDFEWLENISSILPEICSEANSIIESNQTITSAFSSIENEKRYWKIEGFAKVPCGGTHLKSTAEVGELRLKRNNIGRGRERVEIYLMDEKLSSDLNNQ